MTKTIELEHLTVEPGGDSIEQLAYAYTLAARIKRYDRQLEYAHALEWDEAGQPQEPRKQAELAEHYLTELRHHYEQSSLVIAGDLAAYTDIVPSGIGATVSPNYHRGGQVMANTTTLYRVGGQPTGGSDSRNTYVNSFAEAKSHVIVELRGEITEAFRLSREYLADVELVDNDEEFIGYAKAELDMVKQRVSDIEDALLNVQEWEEAEPQEVTENRAWDRHKTSTSESWQVEVYDLGRYWIVAETLTEIEED